jgi:hypothetical protein
MEAVGSQEAGKVVASGEGIGPLASPDLAVSNLPTYPRGDVAPARIQVVVVPKVEQLRAGVWLEALEEVNRVESLCSSELLDLVHE